jgi:hypothetical protein
MRRDQIRVIRVVVRVIRRFKLSVAMAGRSPIPEIPGIPEEPFFFS